MKNILISLVISLFNIFIISIISLISCYKRNYFYTDITFSLSLTRSITHSLTQSLAHSPILTPTHSLTHSNLLSYSVSQSVSHSLTQSLSHSLTHSHTHSLTHSLTLLLGEVPQQFQSFCHGHRQQQVKPIYLHSCCIFMYFSSWRGNNITDDNTEQMTGHKETNALCDYHSFQWKFDLNSNDF